jgi:hypothetical protein
VIKNCGCERPGTLTDPPESGAAADGARKLGWANPEAAPAGACTDGLAAVIGDDERNGVPVSG